MSSAEGNEYRDETYKLYFEMKTRLLNIDDQKEIILKTFFDNL